MGSREIKRAGHRRLLSCSGKLPGFGRNFTTKAQKAKKVLRAMFSLSFFALFAVAVKFLVLCVT
jgi:hypothetical protein